MRDLALLSVMLVAYGLVASRLDRAWISAPMTFVAVGVVVGPGALGVLQGSSSSEFVKLSAELTLAILLFVDASTVNARNAEEDASLPARLLGIGLPLTLVLGTLVALAMFPAAGFGMAVLVAAILAPTDAALGLAVVTNSAVPVRIRRTLNIESGLNDGIATPVVTLALSGVVVSEAGGKSAAAWVIHSVTEIGVALVVAAVLGLAGGWLLRTARRREWTTPLSQELSVLALALLSYAGAVVVGGNGFVSAFAAGILFGAATRGRLHASTEFTETVGLFSSYLVWFIFGAFLAGPTLLGVFEPTALLYAVVSLTVIRMVPVGVALLGSGLRRPTVAFVGWFGPRGLASVVFGILAFDALHGTPDAFLIGQVMSWTVVLSVVAHGISASPLSARYAAWVGRLPKDAPELLEAREPRIARHTIMSRRAKAD